MRPETVHYKLTQLFDRWYETKQLDVPAPLLRGMKQLWKKWAKEEDDYRDGEDTYMYKTPESIENNLFYISDRWRCAFRLKWLIDGIEAGHIK